MRELAEILPRLFDYVDDEIVILSREHGAGYAIVWVNEAVSRSTGRDAAELVGADALALFVTDASDTGALDALTRALAPGAPARVTLETSHPEGGTCWSDLSCAPLDDIAGGAGLTVVMRRDVTAAKETELRLRMREAEARLIEDHIRRAREKAETAERRLNEAIEALPDGLAVYDTEDRLVLFNDAYRKIYPRSADAIVVGAAFEDVLRAGLKAGEYVDAEEDEETWIGERLAAHRAPGAPIEQRLSDDRFVRVLERRTEAGDIVGLRVDITGAKRTERELQSKAEALAEANAAIRRHAMEDALTGLGNRRALDERLAGNGPAAPGAALLHMDLDRFQQINETMGHAAGDEVLRHTAGVLTDLSEAGDLVCRIGGDEFAILTGAGGAERAGDLASRISEALSRPLRYGRAALRFGVSIGIAESAPPSEATERLLLEADMALFEAKRAGRGRIMRFTDELATAAVDNKRLADEILRGLEREEFFPVYQAQFVARTRQPVGLETLCRWRHPERGVLSPDTFLPMADELGIVAEIDRRIFRQACRDVARAAEAGIEIPKISFNIELGRLLDPDLPAEVSAMHELGPRIGVELLESMSLDDGADGAVWAVDALKEAGVEIEIDDFGSCRASILGLVNIRPDQIKIDRQLVFPLTESEEARRLFGAVVGLAKGLGIRVVAEGVETEAHAEIAADLGCDTLQGYALARPMEFSDLGALLAGHVDGKEGGGPARRPA